MLSSKFSIINESNTSKMRNKANELKRQGIPVINFAAGELDFDTSSEIKESAKQAIDKGYNKYTETLGINKLRELVAQKVSSETGLSYSYKNIGITAGAKQALYNTVMAVFDNDDEVIIPTPCWETFPTQVKLSGAKPIFLDTKQSQYQIDIDKLKNLITNKTKGIILNTPNNPTGVIYNQDILYEIAQLAYDNNLWIIFDECYSELTYSPNEHINILKIFDKIRDKTILINSFSKSCSITGWRLGYFAANEIVVDGVKNFQGHTTSNPNSISQYALISYLENNNHQFRKQVQQTLLRRRNIALEIIDTFKYVTYISPQGAFYLFLDFSEIFGATYDKFKINNISDLAEVFLDQLHIAVTPGTAFLDPSCVRISIAISEDEIKLGLSKIKVFLDKLSFA